VRGKSVLCGIVLLCLSTLSLWGQGGSSGSPSASGPSASQGSATIENQMIAYEVLRRIAQQIAAATSRVVCPPASPTGANPCPGTSRGAILLTDPLAMSEIISAKSFDTSAAALCAAYQAPAPSPCDKLPHPAAVAEAFADTTTAVSGLLTAIKNSAAYSNQNFQPTTQSMINLLSGEMSKLNIALRSSSLPGDLDKATRDVQNVFAVLAKAQAASPAAIRPDVDKEFSAFRTALAGTGADGTLIATILKGKALLDALKNASGNYWVLTVSVDAAGGDTRIKHWFWQELVMPTPKPTYNGGAVVSYMLTDKNGNWQTGDMLHYMYDFSKLKSKAVPNTFSVQPPQ
jgi:hypothetical protein